MKKTVSKNILSIKSKKIILFGASGLLGFEFAKHLLSEGAIVICIDLNIDKLMKEFREYGNNFYSIKADITSEKSLRTSLKEIIKKYKSYDVIINCSAIDSKFDDKFDQKKFSNLYSYPYSKWNKSIDVNLTGLLKILKIFTPLFEKNNVGNIILIGSNYGLVSPDHSIYNNTKKNKIFKPIDYVVSKFALIGFLKYLASYFESTNIRVNMLTPCGIEVENQNKIFKKKFANKTLLGRMSKKNEYNGAIQFLCSDSSSFMTGSNLIIDGGWTVT